MGVGSLRRYHGAPKVDQPEAAVPDVPAKSAKVDDWKAYAAARGWDADQTKAQIIEQYEADETVERDTTSPDDERAGAENTQPASEASK